MPRILTQDLVPGMVTAEDVYTYNNQLVLLKDTELSDKTITKLEFYSILSVRIKEDSMVAAPEDGEITGELSYSQKIRNSEEYRQFKNDFDNTVSSMKGKVNDIVSKKTDNITSEELLEDTLSLVNEAKSGFHLFDMLHNMRNYDDPTYSHSVNVALICNVFGKWLGMPDRDVQTLTLAGLLHDVGKLRIPETVIGKPASLTDDEYELVKTHTIEGFNILKQYDFDDKVKNAALMHHERCDGSGYPMGLLGNRIDSFAKIVAIADVYDAMTSARVYRGPLCPFKVISVFESEGLQKYDSEYILVFLEYIVNTYLNNRVRLSNGMEGEIVLINKLDLSHPMVHCGNRYIDLSHEHGLYVEDII